MGKSPFVTVAAALITGLVGFFIGRGTASKTTLADVPVKESESVISVNEGNITSTSVTDSMIESTAAVSSEKLTPTTTPTDKNETTTATTTTVAAIPSTTSSAGNAAVLKRINTGISDDKISAVLEIISKNLEDKRLAYVSSLGQDCSGIFHQIKDSLQLYLPALSGKGDYKYPVYKKDRSSRQVADWYWQNNNLLIVEDPIASKNSIRPGSVMFFGKPNQKYKNMTIEQLTDKNNNYTSNGAIMHVAIVTSVRLDENGNVVDYTMMHGRNPGIHASRSGSKEIQSTRTKGLPPFGNWSQQWVAVANIATPK